jgi:Fe2+ transport system protein FeoA
VRLSELEVGSAGRLCRHVGAPPAPARLADLGFVPDTSVRVLRRAPLGDPIEVEIRGYRVCLRRADLARLCVVPEPAAP